MTQVKPDVHLKCEEPLQGPFPQLILFGDSITQGSCKQELGFNFMPALQDDFVRRLDVINRGFSGYNTANAKWVLPQFMPTPAQADVKFLMVFFGANDACLPESPTGQHIPLAEYAQNLKLIMEHPAVRVQQPRIILITPPPVNEHQLNEASGLRKAETTRQYAATCRQVGEDLDVAILDLWSIMMEKVGWKEGDPLVGSKDVPNCTEMEKMLSDGLHFLPPAYKILYSSLMQLIRAKWPDQNPDHMAFRQPVWSEAPR